MATRKLQNPKSGKENNKDPHPSSFSVIRDIFEIFSVLFQNQLCQKVDRKVVLSTTVYVVCAYVYQYIILSFKLQMNKIVSSCLYHRISRDWRFEPSYLLISKNLQSHLQSSLFLDKYTSLHDCLLCSNQMLKPKQFTCDLL